MASKRFDKDSEEFKFFADFWKMVQAYYVPEDSDEYWDSLLSASALMGKKYQGKLYKCMIQGFLDYAEAMNKENLHGQ